MADLVTAHLVFDGLKRKVFHLTNVGDGTGETNVAKATLTSLTYMGGRPVTSLSVDMIDYNIQGFASVRLYWDHTTADEIAILPAGSGTIYYNAIGGKRDPKSAGGTGNIILTTNGGAAGATYDIMLYTRPKG